ncbi:MAG: hypothetical protein ACLQSR_14265 [Limisphaerales bacterium]
MKEPKNIWKISWWKAWLIVMAAAFLIVLAIIFISPGRPSIFDAMFGAAVIGAAAGTLFVWPLAFVRWLCNLINFRRFLFACACLATLIALFYAEEDWRGWHDWQKFKHQWEAKGEHFDYASVVPPPVPDDQNFALAPVVASSYAAWFDKSGHRVEPYDTNVVNRLRMVAEDYAYNRGQTPTNGNWQRATLTDLRGWQDYYRMIATKTNEFPVPSQPRSPAADVLLALSKYDSTIEELQLSSQQPYSRFPLNYDQDPPYDVVVPHLAALKQCSLVLRLRAIAEMQDGQSDKALADVKLMLRLIDSIQTEPFLISHLVRLAMMQITLQPIYEGLAEHKWSDAQLAELDSDLAKLDFLADYEFSMRGERALAIASVDYFRRHQNRREIEEFFDMISEDENGQPSNADFLIPLLYLIPSGWFYQNELAVAQLQQQWLLRIVDPEKHLVSPGMVNQVSARVANQKTTLHNLFVHGLAPALGSSVIKFTYAQVDVDLARVAIALERYRLAHGNYPDSLDALAPQFMQEVPHDIINGEPLHYQKTDDWQFILYSVGWNETDDGGTVAYHQGSSQTVDINQGDWVWRYPAK